MNWQELTSLQLLIWQTLWRSVDVAEELGFEKLGLDDELIHNALNPIENVKIRNVPGGPSPEMVQLAIDNMNIFLDNEFEKQGI